MLSRWPWYLEFKVRIEIIKKEFSIFIWTENRIKWKKNMKNRCNKEVLYESKNIIKYLDNKSIIIQILKEYK